MKRIFDFAAATIGLVLLSPLLAIVALAIKLDSPGPVFHRGLRMGKGGTPFRIFKFRTMVSDAERRGGGITYQHDPRITRLGAFLRRSKIDELPQLLNVVKGEMSLVGPRPEDPDYLKYYSERQRQVLAVLPGITSIASIRYRNEAELLQPEDWEKVYTETILPTKLDIELNYLKTRSFGQDLLILFSTFLAILVDETRFNVMARVINRSEQVVGQYLTWVVADGALILAAFAITFAIRPLGGRIYFPLALAEMSAGVLTFICFNYIFGVYHRFWRYASGQEAVAILGSVGAAIALLTILDLFLPVGRMPLGALWLGGFFTLIFMAAARYRHQVAQGVFWLVGDFTGFASGRGARILIVGVGEEAQLLTRQIQSSSHREAYQVVGLVDPDRREHGLRIYNVPVYGDRNRIPALAAKLHPDLIIIAIPPAQVQEPKELVELCRATSAQIKMLPAILNWLGSSEKDPGWLDVDDDELLQRKPHRIDEQAAHHLIAGRVVMVTGAAGSIGSELCRQIAGRHPKQLVVVDINESGLYDLKVELQSKVPGLNLTLTLCDISDMYRMRRVFERTRPQLVFHVAAYKHVPVLEEYPEEGLRVNVLGTRIVHSLSESFGAERFMLISSDKAVNPINVLGMTKWLGELIVTSTPPRTPMLSTSVRFGNVLGSRGSVVPIFEKQIEMGGPVTITDPNMTRYFLTLSEAVSLVIQAMTMTRGGDLYALDMGVPINILHLAHRMIRQHGLRPGKDIAIQFVGARPGEKVREELVAPDEENLTTEHPSIYRLRRRVKIDPQDLEDKVSVLVSLNDNGITREQLLSTLKVYVQELRGGEPARPGLAPAAPLPTAVGERRGSLRVEVTDAILLERLDGHREQGPLLVESVNLSAGGLMFETSEPFKPHECIAVRRNSPYSNWQLSAVVVYCATVRPGRFRVGLEFDDKIHSDWQILEREIRRLEKKQEREMLAYNHASRRSELDAL